MTVSFPKRLHKTQKWTHLLIFNHGDWTIPYIPDLTELLMKKTLLLPFLIVSLIGLFCSFTIDHTHPDPKKGRDADLFMLGFEIFRTDESPLNYTDIKIEIYDHQQGKTIITRDYKEMRTNKFSSTNLFENLKYGHDLTLVIQAPNFFSKEISISFDSLSSVKSLFHVKGLDTPPYDINGEYSDRYIFPVKLDSIEVGTELVIPDIYYAYNSDELEPGSLWVLDSVSRIIANNPSLTVELGGHADARGRDEYNLSLSQRRVNRVKDYLLKQLGAGTNSRLIAKGYGESQLLNHCGNGVTCEEQAHKENRRTTFKVMEEEQDIVDLSLEEKMRFRQTLLATNAISWF